jgi:hypothetical protein
LSQIFREKSPAQLRKRMVAPDADQVAGATDNGSKQARTRSQKGRDFSRAKNMPPRNDV